MILYVFSKLISGSRSQECEETSCSFQEPGSNLRPCWRPLRWREQRTQGPRPGTPLRARAPVTPSYTPWWTPPTHAVSETHKDTMNTCSVWNTQTHHEHMQGLKHTMNTMSETHKLTTHTHAVSETHKLTTHTHSVWNTQTHTYHDQQSVPSCTTHTHSLKHTHTAAAACTKNMWSLVSLLKSGELHYIKAVKSNNDNNHCLSTGWKKMYIYITQLNFSTKLSQLSTS